ncbi:transmembrane protein 115 [Lingula anatina]|uniref:Transmembrane protein 115 n=1 Tax=Lingula anatina TaxID=7574 RepID=A0A1S3HXC8_LINAN|nr:transmembrane protein 115 [Lingula anatina]|eukprot:XP_013390216.1 transmembrane protein 115 [Lingula anatina]
MAASIVRRNAPYVKQQFSEALGGSSVVVKSVCGALFVGYLLSFASNVIPYITVTPGYVLPPNFWVWTFLTHCFVQFHIWHVLIDIAVVFLCGKLLEPLWGALELLIFFMVVNVGTALISSLVYIIVYLASRQPDFLFETYIHGLAGFIGGFTVAVKQMMPDHVLFLSPFGKLRNNHIPVLLLVVTVILRVAGALEGPYPIMYTAGLLTSWIYLRFYQSHGKGTRGDMADNFSFASFWPSPVQPVVGVASNTIFSFLVKIKVCKKPERRYDVSSPTTITISLPGTDPQDAERRRQVALKALNERMGKVESQTSWPSMEDESPTKESTELQEVKVHEKSPDVKDTAGAHSEAKSEKEAKHTATSAVPSSGGIKKLPVPDFKDNAKNTPTAEDDS